MSSRLMRFAQGARYRSIWPSPVLKVSPLPVRFSRSASSSSNPATATEKKPSPHVNYYRVYGTAFAKVLLMSLLVYQGIYYGWMKLEQLEMKKTKGEEIRLLEEKIRELQDRAEKLEKAREKQRL